MVSSGTFDEETLAETRKLIASGISPAAVTTQIRIKWNLSPPEAERLYDAARGGVFTPARAAMREEGTKDLIWGFGAFALGGLITALTWIFAGPGGTYFLMWGPMLYGGYRLVKGFTLKFRSSTNSTSVFIWLGAAIVLGGAIVGAGTLAFTAGEIDEPTVAELIWEEDETFLIDDNVVRFSGSLENRNADWSVVDPKLTIYMYNAAGLLVGQRSQELGIQPVHPNQSSRYSIDMTLRENFETYEPEMEWEWILE